MLKAVFDRAAYGCRMFCCWCAQDIEANHFWESMGFVPLAYRAGSEKKSRVHIFWQKRIREGDVTTPWWFPSQTTGGSIREDRLVFPIPPGKHWSDELPTLLPSTPSPLHLIPPSGDAKKRRGEGVKGRSDEKAKPIVVRRQPLSGGLCFAPPEFVAATSTPAERKPREKKPKRKNDPKLVAAARELRDRWLEHVNGGGALLASEGKYDVARVLPAGSPAPLLPAA